MNQTHNRRVSLCPCGQYSRKSRQRQGQTDELHFGASTVSL